MEEKETVKINLTPGFPEGREMVFEGKGNEHPDAYPGALHVKINLKKHHKFRREGADLFMDLEITLKEALLGFKKSVQFLDGSPIKITSEPGKFISNGDKMTLKGKGMPFFKRDNNRGDLHIKFDVKFPKGEEFTPEVREELNKVSIRSTFQSILTFRFCQGQRPQTQRTKIQTTQFSSSSTKVRETPIRVAEGLDRPMVVDRVEEETEGAREMEAELNKNATCSNLNYCEF